MDLLKETDTCACLSHFLISDARASGQWIWKDYDGSQSFSSNTSFPVNHHWQLEMIRDAPSVWRRFLRLLLWIKINRISNRRRICHDSFFHFQCQNEIYLTKMEKEGEAFLFFFFDLPNETWRLMIVINCDFWMILINNHWIALLFCFVETFEKIVSTIGNHRYDQIISRWRKILKFRFKRLNLDFLFFLLIDWQNSFFSLLFFRSANKRFSSS